MVEMKLNRVAVGIDTLNVGFNISQYRVDETAFKQLEQGKESAGDKLFGGKGVSVTWGGQEFNLLAKGTKGYEYILRNNDIRLYLARNCQGGRVYPETFFQFSSAYLWSKGYERAFKEAKGWLNEWAVIEGEKINRVDMCADLAIDLPRLDVTREIVTRARKKADYTQIEHYTHGRHDTGYRIGSGDLMARIYDKAYEIKGTEKVWFKDIWAAGGWDGESGVTRVEFQARRPFLKAYGVNSYEDLKQDMPDMWRYSTCDWLMIKEPNDNDSNHRRWQTSPMWQTVQEARSHFGECLGLLPWKTKQAKIEPLMAQLKGLMTSEVALDSLIRGEYFAKDQLKNKLNSYIDSQEFTNKVIEKRGKYASLLH
jgi:hypothetical protein